MAFTGWPSTGGWTSSRKRANCGQAAAGSKATDDILVMKSAGSCGDSTT